MSQLAQLGKSTALGISIRGTVRSFPDGRPTGDYPETGFWDVNVPEGAFAAAKQFTRLISPFPSLPSARCLKILLPRNCGQEDHDATRKSYESQS